MSLGLDIGKHSIKIVELVSNNGKIEVNSTIFILCFPISKPKLIS
jgi:Tfp pilus assembly PilM family ATPase